MNGVEKVRRRRNFIVRWLFLHNLVFLVLLTALVTIIFLPRWYREEDPGSNLLLVLLPLLVFVILSICQKALFLSTVIKMYSSDSIRVCKENFQERVGMYSVGDIWNMVTRISGAMGVHSIKGIYISTSTMPNAISADIISFGPLKRSVLVIFSDILDFLNEYEVEAIIAHEIGHIRNGDTMHLHYVLHPFLMMGFTAAAVALLLPLFAPDHVMLLGWDIWSIIFLFLFYGFFSIITRNLQVKVLTRSEEKLADYTAARYVGLLPMVNALIKFGQRNECSIAYTRAALKYEIRDMRAGQWKEHYQHIYRIRDPDKVMDYVRDRMAKRDDNNKPVEKPTLAPAEQRGVAGHVPWTRYDSTPPWDWLDRSELGMFVKKLKETKRSWVFSYEPRTRAGKALLTHPTAEDRIVFLWDNAHFALVDWPAGHGAQGCSISSINYNIETIPLHGKSENSEVGACWER